jgi:hypothetical protein
MSDPTPPAVSEAMREAVALSPERVKRRLHTHPGCLGPTVDACTLIDRQASEIARLTGERDRLRRDHLPHMCRDEHTEIRHGLSDDDERCPVCRERDRAEAAEAETARLRADAERFRALMRCGRIKPQGSAGVDPKTGARTYLDQPGSVHFGAEFWVAPEAEPNNMTIWGRHCLHALADDILAFEARAALTSQEKTDG